MSRPPREEIDNDLPGAPNKDDLGDIREIKDEGESPITKKTKRPDLTEKGFMKPDPNLERDPSTEAGLS
jgi:hypothetical protein